MMVIVDMNYNLLCHKLFQLFSVCVLYRLSNKLFAKETIKLNKVSLNVIRFWSH